jgi:hypothetical protein
MAASAHGPTREYLDVTTQAEAGALMDASAAQLNAYALSIPNDPATPPILFGKNGNTRLTSRRVIITMLYLESGFGTRVAPSGSGLIFLPNVRSSPLL